MTGYNMETCVRERQRRIFLKKVYAWRHFHFKVCSGMRKNLGCSLMHYEQMEMHYIMLAF